MESMSFTYQRSTTSLSIATKSSSSHMFDSDSESEEEILPYLPISSEPNGIVDIVKTFYLWGSTLTFEKIIIFNMN